MRFTHNELKNSFEVGTTSNWLVSFYGFGGKHPPADAFNIIDGKWFPALDVDYPTVTVQDKSITVGPNIELIFPVTASYPREIKFTYYETHTNLIHKLREDWIAMTDLVSKKRTKSLADLKAYAMKVRVDYFDKGLNPISSDTYYVVPKGATDIHGDNSFQVKTNSIALIIIGKE